MDLRQIRYFIAVAEEEHFGRASARIRIAQPALSRQIQLLEAELCVELFERLPRGVRLSVSGKTFRDHCIKVLDDLDRAITETQAISRGEAGVLKLGFIEVAAWSGIIPESIMAFQGSHPAVHLGLSSMTTLQQIEALQEGRIDAGFLYNPPVDSSLKVLPASRHKILLGVSVQSELAKRSSVHISELACHPLISFHRRESPAYSDALHGALFDAGVVASVVHEAENEAEMLALVTIGVGVALVNECQRWRLPRGISLVAVDGLDVSLDLAFVYRGDNRTPVLERFLATLLTTLE